MDTLTHEALTHYRDFIVQQVLKAEANEQEYRSPGIRWAYNMGQKVGEINQRLAKES